MALISPLDLRTILIEDVAGSPEIFSFLAIIILSFALAKFDLPNKISLSFFVLFGVLMATYLQGIYVLIILAVGLVSFYSFAKIVR